jgi:hypothetical protein
MMEAIGSPEMSVDFHCTTNITSQKAEHFNIKEVINFKTIFTVKQYIIISKFYFILQQVAT